MKPSTPLPLLFIVCFSILLTGCATAYYKTMESVGIHKRDILVDRVEEARDAQTESKEQFESALEQFTSVLSFDGGELEDKYNQLNKEYERSADRAEDVSERIESVEDVAEALFKEWKTEIEEYQSNKLRQSSEQKLKQTQRQYKKLISAMKKAESKITPVLSALRDQVLFLKHNLNAKAIASLHSELGSIKSDVSKLIKEMEASIKKRIRSSIKWKIDDQNPHHPYL